jgi:predicted permease
MRPSWLRRRNTDAEIDKELHFHLEQSIADLVARGYEPADARRLARIALGGPEQVKEECRDVHRIRWFNDLVSDLRYGVRNLSKSPTFATVALLSIALSVGTTAVVFAAVKAVILQPLPYTDPDRIVQIATDFKNAARSHGDYVFWNDGVEIARRTRTLQSIGLWQNAVLDLARDVSIPAEALYGVRVSASLFPTLGVSPMLGRNIHPEEERGQGNVVILSHGLWRRRFNADPGVIGRSIKLNGQDYVAIGVMAPDFNFPLRREAARTPYPYVEFWAPLRVDRSAPPEGALGGIARLRPGVSISQAQADLKGISAALSREFPSSNRDRTHRVALLRDRTLRSAGSALWLLMAAAGMFLLIGCVNVANLLLARGFSRQREIAVRIAIGAGKFRIVRQLLTESALLACAGGLAGFLVAAAAWRVLPSLVPVSIPRLSAARADATILAFSVATAVLTGLVFGIAPALRSARSALAGGHLTARGDSGRRQDRLRAALVIAEVAITALLVVIGGQLGGRFVELLRADTGFDTDRVFASVVLPARERYPTPAERSLVYRRFHEAIRAIPGVEKAGVVDALPFSGENTGGFVSANAAAPFEERNQLLAEIDIVGGEYLQAMGVRLLEGRWFRDEEAGTLSEAAIVDDAVAKRLWPAASAIGQRLCVFCTPERPDNWKRVVGVVSSMRHASLEGTVHHNVYLAGSAFERAAFLVVRSNRRPGELDKAIRTSIAAIDPNQPVLLGTSMRSLVADSIADRRFVATLLGVTGCLALLLSAAGVYGVAAYMTSRRTQEIGIRVALGATPTHVHALVLRQGIVLVVFGLTAGLTSAVLLMQWMRSQVSDFAALNPAWTGVAAVVVVLTAAIACWIPARRATSIDPVIALRGD